MQKIDSHIQYAPSDLVKFMESSFVSWMDRFALEYPEKAPEKDKRSELIDALAQKGLENEQKLITQFEAQGLAVRKIVDEHFSNQCKSTLQAMQDGVDVIAQAALTLDNLAGHCDFLVKQPGSSQFGDYEYVVWESKLSTQIKPTFVIQLCAYTEMLAAIQNTLPSTMVLALGPEIKQELQRHKYFAYYKALKNAFFEAQNTFDPNLKPDPSLTQNWGDWSDFAIQSLLEQDHLSQIANITHQQIKKLEKAGIKRMDDFVQMSPDNPELLKSGLNKDKIHQLHAQASIQKETLAMQQQGQDKPCFRVININAEPAKGLALLPPASPLDVFFDIEGYPLIEGGLEYLWGATYYDEQGNRTFKDFWAHTHEQEKQAFSEFIQWVYARWKQDPSMHIYHYAPYEITACRKLMGRYGVCEFEVDELLRNNVFIDLYRVVKTGILLGEPKYSIKNVEHLYRAARDTEVGNGGDSVVAYEQWRDEHAHGLQGDDWSTSSILKNLRDYNIDDCNSTEELTLWLREQQQAHHIQPVRSTSSQEETQEELDLNPTEQLRDTLLLKAQAQQTSNPEEAALTNHLAWTLEFHKREQKPVFWKLYDRLDSEPYELENDLDCLINCHRTEREAFKPTPRARQLVYEYAFDPQQDFKGSSKNYYLLNKETEDGKKIKVEFVKDESDLKSGLICLKAKEEPAITISLIPDEYVNPNPIPQTLERIIRDYDQGQLDNKAIQDYLKKRRPDFIAGSAFVGEQTPIAQHQDPAERLKLIVQAAKDLNQSYLTIQGPPGAGKSYTAKHIIGALAAEGKTIGITSNSHKAINHLLLNTLEYCEKEKITATFACAKDDDDKMKNAGVKILKNNQLASNLKPGSIVGTTAWGFAREDMENQLDYLFVDEAGQVSVANLIAMSQATKNIILMGDQMQLGQPLQGTHPEMSGLSVLDYLLNESTVPDYMGIFLGTTYRMNSLINEFISEQIYDGKLTSAPANDGRILKLPQNYPHIYPQVLKNKKAGIIPVFIAHNGNIQASEEEVEIIYTLAHALLGKDFHTSYPQEDTRKISWEDMLFVAPYNHQVSKLQQALGPHAQVGSVDKFQGQEAPIVFLSMCTSNAADSPRGLEFLFDRNRLNVAVSRAQTLAIVVGHPNLQLTPVNSIDQMEAVNLFCALVQRD